MGRRKSISKIAAFRLDEEEIRLARQLAKLEKREGHPSIHLWCREVVRQYLHEYRVLAEKLLEWAI